MVVTLYEDPGFAGRSIELDVGRHQLMTTGDLLDAVSSVRVTPGFVALGSEHSDQDGAFGRSVDLLEDCADLGSLGLGDTISFVEVFAAERDVVSRNHGTGTTDTSTVAWVRGAVVGGHYVAGHWERPRAGGQPPAGRPVVSPGPLPHLLHLSKIDGSPMTNPAFDTSAADWSSRVVGGKTFDGSSSNALEWVSVLNPTLEQDDETGVTGFAVIPEVSQFDLPFTHPFGPDFEFAVVPDPDYEGLLATSNRDATGGYAGAWADARRVGLSPPVGVLALEVDAALVPPAYRAETGDRVALFGRWIVDAGHPDFHTEIHPPLIMARARPVNDQGTVVYPDLQATTAVNLWSRPYQPAQYFTDGSTTGLTLSDYLTNIAETLGDISAYPPLFARAFDGIHLVAFTVRPPVPSVPASNLAFGSPHLECSYSLTVNGSTGVQVQQSPDDSQAVLVILALNSVGLPTLPELPNAMVTFKIEDLLAQIPSDLGVIQQLLVSAVELYQSRFGFGEADIYVRRYSGPADPSPAAAVVPFTELATLPRSSVTVDNNQPFPVIGWIKVKWVYPTVVIADAGPGPLSGPGTGPVHQPGPILHGPVRPGGGLRIPPVTSS